MIASSACEIVEGAGDVFFGWADSLGETVTPVNPFDAEMIAFGRATLKIARSTFVSDGKRGIRNNYSCDFRMVGSSSGLIKKSDDELTAH